MEVRIRDLVKDYGRFRALDGISLQIGGGMFGLLGPNGAGKTTMMRLLTTSLRPTSGQVLMGEIDLLKNPGAARRHLGYLPQSFGFYGNLTAYETLDYIGIMKNIAKAERRRQVEHVLEQVNLTRDGRRRVAGFSGGMKQRLGIAQALLGNPAVIVVDEPTAGLDPEERVRFRNLLARLSGERTVILSTHIVADVEASCTALAVMRRGSLAFVGAPAELMAAAKGQVWHLEVTQAEWGRVESQFHVVASRTEGQTVQLRILAATNPLDRGVAVEPGLEDGYLAIMGGGGRG